MRVVPRLAACVLAAGALAAAAAPWRVSRSVVASALVDELAPGADVRAVAKGRVTVKLLPRPRLQATDLSVTAGDGAVLLDAPLLKAELDIPSLLRGAWRMASATLVEPTVTVDVDRLAARSPGRGAAQGAAAVSASAAGASGRAASSAGTPVMIRLRSGLVRTRSTSGLADLLATAVDASAAWSDDGLVVSGSATLRGTATQFTGTLKRPAFSLTGAGSPAFLQVVSPAFDLSADGLLSDGAGSGSTDAGGPQPQFVGRASFSTAALPRLLRTLDDAPLPLAFARIQVAGDVVAKPRELSLSNAQFRLDGARFEGTLAWRQQNGRGLLAGTLATDMFDIGALGGEGLNASGADGLYGRTLTSSPLGTDLDLRVSATAARLGRMTLADAAFGALVHGDRLELTLDEAAAYRGLVKARAVVMLGPGGISAHADLAARQLDLGALSDGLSGRGRVDGAVTGRAALEGHGASLRAVMSDLAGDGQIGVEGARVAGLSLAPALRRLGRRTPVDPERRSAPTVFDRAQWEVSIRDGVVRIPKGRLTAPGVALDFGAETALTDGRVDLRAVAAQTDDAGAPLQGGSALPLRLEGFWSGPLTLVGGRAVEPGHVSPPGVDMPRVDLPLIDGLGAGR